jgi:hypothetical protein
MKPIVDIILASLCRWKYLNESRQKLLLLLHLSNKCIHVLSEIYKLLVHYALTCFL